MDILTIALAVTAVLLLVLWVGALVLSIRKDYPTIGKLYIHEGDVKDTYSFAFDCPLDKVKGYSEVLLKIECRKVKDTVELIKKMEEDYENE